MKQEKQTLRDDIYEAIQKSFKDPTDFAALDGDILTSLQDNVSDLITEKILSLIKPDKEFESMDDDSCGYNERNEELNDDIKKLIL